MSAAAAPIDLEALLPSLGIVPHSSAPLIHCTARGSVEECSGKLWLALDKAGWKGSARMSTVRIIDRMHSVAIVSMRSPAGIKHTIRIVSRDGDRNLHLYSKR